MAKIFVAMALTALSLLAGNLFFEAPLFDGCLDTAVSQAGSLPATATPPLIYAGIRG